MRTKEQTENAIAELRKQIPEFAKKIHKFYVATKWKWFDRETYKSNVPTVKQIEKQIEHDLNYFIENMNVTEATSGGIRIIENDFEDEKFLTVEFHYGINGYLE